MSFQDGTDVMTAFLQLSGGRILLLQRSNNVGSYPGKWGAVSGYVETRDPFLQAEIEIREETGIDRGEVDLRKRGLPVFVKDTKNNYRWRVHPFRFEYRGRPEQVTLSDEHRDFRWCDPDSMQELPTVPKLREVWDRVRR